MNKQIKFFTTLFDPEDSTNICKNLWESSSIDSAYTHDNLPKERLCFNALSGPRCNSNVTKLRTILIESDKNELDSQLEWLASCKLPYSAVLFSGNKSLHIFISLTEPIKTISKYKKLVDSLYAAITDSSNIRLDESCKTPSQLSRYPNAVRSDTGEQQTLLVVKDRVKISELQAWIAPRLPKEFVNGEKALRRLQKQQLSALIQKEQTAAVLYAADLPEDSLNEPSQDSELISFKTRQLAENFEIATESRHEAFKNAVVQMTKNGIESDFIKEYLTPAFSALVPDRPLRELANLIKWSERNVIPESGF